jgi:mannose/fructose/N-acetylgalactosamine-specific phosphotransferase system component IIC
VNWLALGLLGGVVGLDATSFPQMMLSRPIVSATLTGLLFGRPAAGLLLGALLEVFALLILPFGAARYPESGTSAAAAASAYAATTDLVNNHQALLLAVVFALAWEQIAGASVIFTRRINERLVRGREGSEPLAADQVSQRHLLAIGIDFVRGAWAVLIGSMLGRMLLRITDPMFGLNDEVSARLLALAGAVMLASLLPLFGGLRARWLPLLTGLVCGSLILFLA